MGVNTYTLEQAEEDIGTLRGLVDKLTEVLTMQDGSVVPNTPAANNYSQFSSQGYPDCIAAEGDKLQMSECRLQVSPHNQGITSTTPAAITGLSKAVEAATYIVEGRLTLTTGTWSTASTANFRFTGPAVSEFDIQSTASQIGSSSLTNAGPYQFAGTSSGSGGYGGGFWTPIGSFTTGSAIVFTVNFWCEFTFTATGTLVLNAAEGVSPNTWTLDYGYMIVKPVT